jgi:signal transduction histidine kinase
MESGSFRPTHAGILSTDLRPFFPVGAPSTGAADLIVDLRNHASRINGRFEPKAAIPDALTEDGAPRIESVARSIREIEALHLLSNGLAHDLNNLFQVATSALSLIELRSKLGRETDIPALIEKAELALDRARTVVRRLIQLPVHPVGEVVNVDVNATVKSMRSLFTLLAGPGIDVSLGLTLRKPVISCDSLDFENALLNLVTNAKNAISDEGQIVIKTSVEVRPPTETDPHERSYVVVMISDSGHGMPEDVAARAFDAFYSTRTDSGGTGLGLAMVRRFLSDVNGTSEIESTVGSGTSISLAIPAVHSSSANDN